VILAFLFAVIVGVLSALSTPEYSAITGAACAFITLCVGMMIYGMKN